MKETESEFDQADIRYSESRKLAEIAAHMSKKLSVRVAVDGHTGSRAS